MFFDKYLEDSIIMMSSTIELRFARSEDIPDASEFVLLALNDNEMQSECAEVLGSDFSEHLETYGPQNILLAFDNTNNHAIVGFLEINEERSIQGQYCISTLYVLPAYREQDVARSLVQKMLEEKCSPGEELLIQACHECDLKYWKDLGFAPKSTVLSLKRK